MPVQRSKGARYTPIAKRQDKPDGIAWLLKHHPELTDAQISKLLGTTKTTINAVRDRSHWNSSNIRARDPMDLGLCSYGDYNAGVVEIGRPCRRSARPEGSSLSRASARCVPGSTRTIAETGAGRPLKKNKPADRFRHFRR